MERLAAKKQNGSKKFTEKYTFSKPKYEVLLPDIQKLKR